MLLCMFVWHGVHRGFVNWISGDEIQILFLLAIRFSGLIINFLICLLWFWISRYLRSLGARASTSWTWFGINRTPFLLYLRWNEAQERLVQVLAFKLLFFSVNLSVAFVFLGIVFILIVNERFLLCLILLWFVSITFRPTVRAIGSFTKRELLQLKICSSALAFRSLGDNAPASCWTSCYASLTSFLIWLLTHMRLFHATEASL